MPKLILPVSGLHCRACEILSEEKLSKIKNVTKVRVSQRRGEAEIFYNDSIPDQAEIRRELRALGYDLTDDKTGENKKTEVKTDTTWLSALLIIAIVYLLLKNVTLFDFSSYLNQEFSWPLALLVGLAAGVSTCLALVGGLVLGLAANYSKEHPEATKSEKFKPHLLFNLGRVGGFFLLGGILGLIGSELKPSPLFNGLLTITVAFVLLFLGAKLLNFPGLNKFEVTLPKSLGRKIKTNNPWLLGALTFFLPCGFTQAMQIYALNSGNFFSGALTMSMFALGTVPGLLGLGGLSAVLGNKRNKLFFTIAGAIVVLFAILNLNNGWKLIQVSTNSGNNNNPTQINLKNTDDGPNNNEVQIVKMTETNRGYSPNQLTVIKGRPVRWIIDAQAPYSCASSLIAPSIGIQRQLKPGENIIEFTPKVTGEIPFSCSMGMYTGKFIVIEK